jgi:2'-5' RNA ligase
LWWLPDIPSEQDEAYRRIWQNLRQSTQVADGRHDSAEWRNHTGDFALCCVRIPASSLTSNIEDLRAVLRHFPFVRLHPDAFLHITVQELGFIAARPRARDEISPQRLAEFIAQADLPISDFPAFDVSLGGVNSFVDAAFLDVHDDGWLARIQRRLIDFVAIPPDQRFSFLPQVTIAHYTEAAPIDNLPAALAPWRDQTFGVLRVESIDIVRLRTDETYPQLTLEHTFELGRQHPLFETMTST